MLFSLKLLTSRLSPTHHSLHRQYRCCRQRRKALPYPHALHFLPFLPIGRSSGQWPRHQGALGRSPTPRAYLLSLLQSVSHKLPTSYPSSPLPLPPFSPLSPFHPSYHPRPHAPPLSFLTLASIRSPCRSSVYLIPLPLSFSSHHLTSFFISSAFFSSFFSAFFFPFSPLLLLRYFSRTDPLLASSLLFSS